MKRIVSLLFLLPFTAAAQNKPLLIEGTAPNFYILHTVAPKENYYSIGRLYNASPKEIAPFNKLDLAKGLNLNQAVKIPLTTSNFVQSAAVEADEVLVPVYHTVKEKEGLYRISTEYNKLPLATIKQWNNLTGDAVTNGTNLVVGYLKVKKGLSALSSQAKPVMTAATGTSPVKPAVVKEVEVPEKNISKEKVSPVSVAKPVVTTELPAKKETATVLTNNTAAKAETKNWSGRNFNKAFFKSDYEKQTKTNNVSNEAGAAAVFKSTSGWEDGKYYCLHNTAAPGSIIKITSNSTGKIVYAKVLDMMPDIKQNTDLVIRISNAASEELGVGENKFDCTLSFSK